MDNLTYASSTSFNQAHDVLKNIRGRTGDTDYCEIGEQEKAAERLLTNKAPGFDCLGLDIIRDVLHYHPRWF